MNYGELKSAVASDSHRTDLTTVIPRFIREAEGMIRRELIALTITATLTESDRLSNGTYNLPSGLQSIRAIYTSTWSLEKVSLAQLHNLPTTAEPSWFTGRGTNRVEFRGIPSTDAEFDIEYMGHPAALADDSDTNDILTNHESLYKEAALFYLYKHTQDLELAQGAIDTYSDILKKLNEQFGRRHGGANIAGAYNLYGGQSAY